MRSDRWQQIEKLYFAALEREPDERRAFLESACSGDEGLRREVESLVAASTRIGSFLEPAGDAVARQAPASALQYNAIGQVLGPYRVLALLGEGGMGSVYLAEDTRLGRRVAIKLLPPQFTSDRVRLIRFEREARAASALNHPNILTIHDVGFVEFGSEVSPYLVSEYVDGETLRQRMQREPLTLSYMLDVAIQVASALAAAHAAGITHRDVKPENVMMRPDGLVKVLDFGLAKLTEQQSTINPPGGAQLDTEPEMILGTVRYMSPEQVRGEAVDARSDIFSLGVMIYEITTGHAPFEGRTTMHVLVALLSQEPPPLTRNSTAAPEELERIVRKALRKDREERYQSVKELLQDLQNLKQQLGTSTTLEQPGHEAKVVETMRPLEVAQIASHELPETNELRAKAPGATASNGIKRNIAWRLILAVTILLLALAGLAYFTLSRKPAIDSIAVLPFENAGADPEAEYLSDGITESLINSLSQLPSVRVVPRSTVFHYKGRVLDPQEIGRQLGVRAVLTGRVTPRGDMLNIQTDLIDVDEVAQLWGEHYQRKLSDIFALQEEISQEITENMRLRLSSGERQQLTKRYTENTEAYRLYLKGRYHWNQRTVESLNRGIEYFRQAIGNDPYYALAYAGLADSYSLLGSVIGGLSPRDTFPQAKAAAQKALQLDETLAEAHAALALVSLRYDWDWPATEREINRALALNPAYATTHQWYSHYLTIRGRSNEAIDEIKRAQELEPVSLIINSMVGVSLYYARRYDEAIEQYQKTLELDPNFAQTYYHLGWAYVQTARYKEAIAAFKNATALSPDSARFVSALGHAYAVSGQRGEARKILDQLRRLSQQQYVSPGEIAMIYVGLGEPDQAFAWLDKAYAERSWPLPFIKAEPRFDSLRTDPRFADLLRRVGLPQ